MDVYDFGVHLKELRKSKGLTQAQVGERIDLSSSLVSEYEANLKLPTITTLRRLALIYGTSTDSLLGIKYELVVNLTGLTESQREIVASLVATANTLCDEFKRSNES